MNRVNPKHPDAIVIYMMDWTTALNPLATISTSTWVVGGLTKTADAIVTGSLKTTVTVTGGVDGQDYLLTNTVVTSDGETLVESGQLRVRVPVLA